MSIHLLYLLTYCLNITICILAGILLLTLRQLREAKSPKYRYACRTLALASITVGLGKLLIFIIGTREYPINDLLSFPALLLASMQALAFTFLLTLLLRGKHITGKNLVLHALPSILFTVLYALSRIFFGDVTVYDFSQWKMERSHPTLIIRTLYCFTYIIQLVLYSRLFYSQRNHFYQHLKQLSDNSDKHELRWITRGFNAALIIGISVVAGTFCSNLIWHSILTCIITIFYATMSLCYANYHYTYGTIKTNVIGQQLAETTSIEVNRSQKFVEQLPSLYPNRLFQRIELIMEKELLYLDKDLDRRKLADRLATNQKYLADAIRCSCGLTVTTYITGLRLQHALTLMQECPQMQFVDVAIDSGFASYPTFHRCFTKRYTISPSDYKKQFDKETTK